MTLDDQKLLDFDTSRLAAWDEVDTEQLLTEQPDLYRNHLVIAKWIDRWLEDMTHPSSGLEGKSEEGFQEGLREISAHLRQGDLLPGGGVFEQTVSFLSGKRVV